MIPFYQGLPAVEEWLASRTEALANSRADSNVGERVAGIIAEVRKNGDSALRDIAKKLGDPEPRVVGIDDPLVESACRNLSIESKATLEFAASRIRTFASSIMEATNGVVLQFDEYSAGLDFRPVQRAACYVPGGRYPLPSTALMTAITASVAGVEDVFILTPVLKDEILYAGRLAGVSKFVQIGGAQAVAAAAFGTASVPRADMVVGPGNAYVTEAKRQLLGTIGIDMLAGPSEVAIIADSGANAEWVCLDLLSQAEHDPDARCYLLTDSLVLAEKVLLHLPKLMAEAKLPDFIKESIGASAILVLPSIEDCARISDSIAPEHLALNVVDPEALKPLLKNYGALFMGRIATVPFGDYCAGPNHTLPTGATARFASGLSPLTFLRTQSWLSISQSCNTLAQHTATFAAMEGLLGHKEAALARVRAQ